MPQSSVRRRTAQETERATLLIVEDDAALRVALEHGLSAECFDVEAVPDAETAYRLVVERRPQVILLDWRLPGGEGGLLACRKLRALHPDAPVVMHSGLGDPRDRRAALEAGAYAFVAKGTPLASLAGTLRAAMTAQNPVRSKE